MIGRMLQFWEPNLGGRGSRDSAVGSKLTNDVGRDVL